MQFQCQQKTIENISQQSAPLRVSTLGETKNNKNNNNSENNRKACKLKKCKTFALPKCKWKWKGKSFAKATKTTTISCNKIIAKKAVETNLPTRCGSSLHCRLSLLCIYFATIETLLIASLQFLKFLFFFGSLFLCLKPLPFALPFSCRFVASNGSRAKPLVKRKSVSKRSASFGCRFLQRYSYHTLTAVCFVFVCMQRQKVFEKLVFEWQINLHH